MAFSRPYRVLLLSALLIGLCAATASPLHAQGGNDTDWKQGKWGHLSQYIGTYQLEAVLTDPEVSAMIDKILDEDQKKIFMANMDVTAPIGFESDCLVITGNAQKEGNAERAYLNVCLYAGKINIGIYTDSAVTIYSSEKTYAYLPLSLRVWAYMTTSPNGFEIKPTYVQMVNIAE